ncbi:MULTISPECIES: carbohydrate ABC transporter permease [unclassified Microbacterium]|uniref:carbohydrate ABC transporter permease n=1 Tax=Microbacterium TaxID=33882 RepID=UPI003B9DF1C3
MTTLIESTDASPRPDSRPVGRKRLSQDRGLIVLALPSIIWYGIWTIGPLIAMFCIAFLSWRGFNATPKFAGMDNFTRMLSDPQMAAAFINTGIHLVATMPLMMIASFMLGYFLSLRLPGHRVLRIIMFIPALISISALGMMFIAVLGPVGMVNSLLEGLGLADLSRAWLQDPQTALLSIIVITIWSGTGFNAILLAARLASIDDEIYAAAELDGAGDWQKMWRIAFPIAMDYFGVLTMLQYLWNLFGSAGLILILTRGGPGDSTVTLSWLVYRWGGTGADVGYSQAIGILLFILGIGGLLLIRRVFRARY